MRVSKVGRVPDLTHETVEPDLTGLDEPTTEETNRTYAAAVARSERLAADLEVNPANYRILSGDRPTGQLHLGHYFGTVANRVRLQRMGVEHFQLIADYQVITDRDSVGNIKQTVLGLLADYYAAGMDLHRATVFTHSSVPALNQLMLPFLSLTTVSELRRNPTVKAEDEATGGRAMSGLLLTYPVHQAADILFCQGQVVPVGRDQLPHIEATRLIARRFNERYAQGNPVFTEPIGLLSQAPLLLGTDGVKMSKSRNNTIQLSSTADEAAKLLKRAKTDSDRVITYDPASRPEVSNLLLLASLCLSETTGAPVTPESLAEQVGDGGGGALKGLVTEAVNEFLAPIRARRAEALQDPSQLWDALRSGNERANEVAQATLNRVRQVMDMDY